MDADRGWSLEELVDTALSEDVGRGDATTEWTVGASQSARASIVAKADGVISGEELAGRVFRKVGEVEVDWLCGEGCAAEAGDEIARLTGSARAILTGERVALNFLQRLSGVATLTARFARAVEGTGTRILDTRKTTPGYRDLERQAVRSGGGTNHRFGLDDMVLIKENHIRAAGSIREAVEAVRAANDRGLRVEIETTSLIEVQRALDAGVDRIMFDNMPVDLLSEAVDLVRTSGQDVETEASGGVTLQSVRSIAETGVDFISVGALTHSAPALDLSLLFNFTGG